MQSQDQDPRTVPEPALAAGEGGTPPPAPQEGDEAARGFAAFMAALKAVGFYPPGNPVRDRLVEALLRQVQAAPQEVMVSIRQDALLWAGRPALTRGGEGWDLVMRLYEAGLRDLTFFPQAVPAELHSLLDLLARTVRGELNPTDEDLSVLLWEMDLPSVAYRVIDATEEPASMAMLETEAPPGAVGDDPEAWEGIHPLERYLASAGGLEQTDLDPRQFIADREELARLRNAAKLEGHQLRPKLIMVLLELLLVGLDPEEFERITTLLRGYAFDTLQMGRFSFFGRMLQRLRERTEEVTGEQAPPLAGLVGELSGADAAGRALAALEAGRCDDEQAAWRFLSGLAPAGMRTVLDRLAEGESDPVGAGDEQAERPGRDLVWRVAAAALRAAVLETPERVLGDPRGLGARHLEVLARLVPAGQPPGRARFWSQSLSPLWAGGDAPARAGALRLLATVRPPDLERLLHLGLGDPDALVRQTAAALFAEVFGTRALQPLLQILLGHGFDERSYEEQSAFYEAITRAAPEEVFPLLEKTLRRRDWLAPRRWRVQKACALRALGGVPIERSGALLMRYRASQDPLLADASRHALERHRRRLQGPAAVRKAA